MLRAKKAELNVDISSHKAQCAVIRQRMQKGATASGNDHENRVNKLLGLPEIPVVDSDNVTLQALLIELSDLQAASSAVDSAILTETRLASSKLLETVKPDVTRLGSVFAKAFIALRSAHLAYNKHVDEIESAGANVESLRISLSGISDPLDATGSYPYCLREFANAGFISKSLAPEMI